MRKLLVFVLLALCASSSFTPPAFAQSPAVILGNLALDVQGNVTFKNPRWTQAQPLLVGTVLGNQDFVTVPQGGSLVVLCQVGTTVTVAPGQQVLCPKPSTPPTDDNGLLILRGVAPPMPTLISPQDTLVRKPNISLVWEIPHGMTFNYIQMLDASNQKVWRSDDPNSKPDFDAKRVIKVGLDKDTWSYLPPVTLDKDSFYTVDICASDAQSMITCYPTKDQPRPRIYYHFDQTLEGLLTGLQTLPADQPALASAMILAQPREIQPGLSYSYYAEAIDRLTAICNASSPTCTPEVARTLAEYYLRIGLSPQAHDWYEKALQATSQNTPSVVKARILVALGLTDGIDYFNRALVEYARYLNQADFDQKVKEICTALGNDCPKLEVCTNQPGVCQP